MLSSVQCEAGEGGREGAGGGPRLAGEGPPLVAFGPDFLRSNMSEFGVVIDDIGNCDSSC